MGGGDNVIINIGSTLLSSNTGNPYLINILANKTLEFAAWRPACLQILYCPFTLNGGFKKNVNNFSFISDKTIKLWKVSERDRRAEGYNLKEKQPFSFFDVDKIET